MCIRMCIRDVTSLWSTTSSRLLVKLWSLFWCVTLLYHTSIILWRRGKREKQKEEGGPRSHCISVCILHRVCCRSFARHWLLEYYLLRKSPSIIVSPCTLYNMSGTTETRHPVLYKHSVPHPSPWTLSGQLIVKMDFRSLLNCSCRRKADLSFVCYAPLLCYYAPMWY